MTINSPKGDDTPRFIYADYLDRAAILGAEYLRTKVALSRAAESEAAPLRRKLLEIIPRLPQRWRDRFGQPDLLLAPPVPFATGWYAARATAPSPYRSLPNLDPDMLTPEMPWLTGKGIPAHVDGRELVDLMMVQDCVARLNVKLPTGFESLIQDFRRRRAVSADHTSFSVHLGVLALSSNELGDAAVAALAGSPVTQHLTELDLRYTGLGSDGTHRFLNREAWPRLMRLNLRGNRLIAHDIAQSLRKSWGQRIELDREG